jgi:hypothetical protein
MPATGPYRLRLIGTDGRVNAQDFAAMGMDHDSDTLAFAFSVPHPGSLQTLEIWRGEHLLLRQEAAQSSTKSVQVQRTALGQSNSTGQTPTGWQVKESGDQLRVTWDAKAWPYLMVTHIGAQRTTLTADARGGDISLPLKDLPTGGSFEFSVSDGINSQRWEQTR